MIIIISLYFVKLIFHPIYIKEPNMYNIKQCVFTKYLKYMCNYFIFNYFNYQFIILVAIFSKQ